MYKWLKTLNETTKFLVGYTVRIYYDGTRTEQFTYTRKGAFAIAKSYPVEAFIIISAASGSRMFFSRGYNYEL